MQSVDRDVTRSVLYIIVSKVTRGTWGLEGHTSQTSLPVHSPRWIWAQPLPSPSSSTTILSPRHMGPFLPPLACPCSTLGRR